MTIEAKANRNDILARVDQMLARKKLQIIEPLRDYIRSGRTATNLRDEALRTFERGLIQAGAEKRRASAARETLAEFVELEPADVEAQGLLYGPSRRGVRRMVEELAAVTLGEFYGDE